MITGQDKPDFRHLLGRPDGQAGLCRPEPPRRSIQQDGVEELFGRPRHHFKLGSKEICQPRLLGSFNFKGADQQKKVGQLSGRLERNRVNLARC